MHRLTLEGKIIVFKTSAKISKIVFLSLILTVPKEVISRLQCSWVRRLYDNSFHEWKVMPLKLKKNPLDHILNFTPIFYSISSVLMIVHPFTQTSSVIGKNISSCILSQYLSFYQFLIVDNSYVNFIKFSNKNINFMIDLVNENCNFKS